MNALFPTYLTSYDFNPRAFDDFIKSTTEDLAIDEYNNLILSADIDEEDIEEVDKFLIKALPRKNMMDSSQIENFIDTNVTEFSDTVDDAESVMSDSELALEFAEEVEEEIGDQLAQEQILQRQIDELADTLEVEIEKGVRFKEDANQAYDANKDVIVAQRIQMGEGKTLSDFSDKFPFLPKSEEEQESDDPDVDKFPYIGTS